MDQRIYPFKPNQEPFKVGVAGGKQVLLQTVAHEIRAHWFTPDGELINLERQQMAVARWRDADSGFYHPDAEYWRLVEGEVEAFKQRIGFVPGEIRVRRFETEVTSIEDLPGDYEGYLSGEEVEEDEEEREYLEAAIQKWHEEGNFVWYSGYEQYFLDASGEVFSKT